MKRSVVIRSLLFKYLERCGVQGVSFLVTIVLARLLMPEDYGVVAILSIFITLSQVFVQSGLNTALIQKLDADDLDFSTVFYLSLGLAVVIYGILFVAAPVIERFYNMEGLARYLRILSLILIPGAFNSVQNAKVAKEMLFQKVFYAGMGAVVISGAVGIVMAYMGFGAYALIGQQLSNNLVLCVILWFLVKWRPKLCFSWQRGKALFGYGWKLLVSSLLNTVYNDIRSLCIGKVYNAEQLAFYSKGWQFPSFMTTNINGTIDSVMLPVLSSEQKDAARMKQVMRRSIVTSSFFVFPLMAGLAAISEPLVLLLMTEKWLPCVPVLQIGCVVYALLPIHTANLQAINAMGRSDIYLKLEIVKKIIGLAIVLLTLPFGIYVIAAGSILNSVIGSIINVRPNKKLLDYGYMEQIRDVLPAMLLSVLMFVVVLFIGYLPGSELGIMALQILAGMVVYAGLAWLFRLSAMQYVLSIIKGQRKK